MTIKNVKKSNFTIKLENGRAVNNIHKQIEETDVDMQERDIKRSCRKIAGGVLVRLNIHAETKSLTTVLENYEARNNLIATTEWVYNLTPEQDEVSAKIIEGFTIQLRELIFEYMEFQ